MHVQCSGRTYPSAPRLSSKTMDKTTKKIVWMIVAILATWGIFAATKKGTPGEAKTIRIGVSLPLSGEAASYGEGGKAGVDSEIKEINEAGGIEGRMVEAVFEDDQCNAKNGSTVSNKLANVDNVVASIGPVCSAAAGRRPADPLVRQDTDDLLGLCSQSLFHRSLSVPHLSAGYVPSQL